MKLYGKNPVLERIKTSPRSVLKLYVAEGHPDAGYVHQKAKQYGVPMVMVPGTKLQKLARNANTQGIVAEVEEFVYISLEDLLAREGSKRKILVFIDELNDPQNLGAIIRSLACLGNFAVVIPSHNSVDVTETVLRVACGGENHVPVAKVKNLAVALSRAKDAGYWIVGAVVKGGQTLWDTKFNFPLGLVVGSEQKGIRDVIARYLDGAVTVPMAHQRMAMNAAHAASIIAYEVTRQHEVKR